jgi:hypothetical protein
MKKETYEMLLNDEAYCLVASVVFTLWDKGYTLFYEPDGSRHDVEVYVPGREITVDDVREALAEDCGVFEGDFEQLAGGAVYVHLSRYVLEDEEPPTCKEPLAGMEA